MMLANGGEGEKDDDKWKDGRGMKDERGRG